MSSIAEHNKRQSYVPARLWKDAVAATLPATAARMYKAIIVAGSRSGCIAVPDSHNNVPEGETLTLFLKTDSAGLMRLLVATACALLTDTCEIRCLSNQIINMTGND